MKETVWKRHCRPERSRWREWALIAAGVMAIAFALIWFHEPEIPARPPQEVARVDRVSGAVFTSDGSQVRKPVAPGTRFVVGSVLATAPDANAVVSARLFDGQSLRLKPGTEVRFSALLHVWLERGTVYYDSLNTSAIRPFAIRTAAGDFRPKGTQFELERTGDLMQLTVREGIVQFIGPRSTADVQAGERLTIRANGAIERSVEKIWGERWNWVLETAPILNIEGRPLRAFLSWIAREKGLKVEYANARTAKATDELILHGVVSQLKPDEALQSVASNSGFQVRIEEGVLIVAEPAHMSMRN
jgi:ferric-dicitrate binding protein FerR (iron transport regulator)